MNRTARILRQVLTDGQLAVDDSGSTCIGNATSYDRREIAALVAAGLLLCRGNALEPGPLAREWLRRSAAGAGCETEGQSRLVVSGQAAGAEPGVLNALASRTGPRGRQWLEPHHVEAARRIGQMFERAHLQPRVTANPEPVMVERSEMGSGDLTDMAADARRALARLAGVVGNDAFGLLIDVCGFGKGLQTIETERQWPRRSAKIALRIGLSAAALHLGISEGARGPTQGRGRTWMGSQGRLAMNLPG